MQIRQMRLICGSAGVLDELAAVASRQVFDVLDEAELLNHLKRRLSQRVLAIAAERYDAQPCSGPIGCATVARTATGGASQSVSLLASKAAPSTLDPRARRE